MGVNKNKNGREKLKHEIEEIQKRIKMGGRRPTARSLLPIMKVKNKTIPKINIARSTTGPKLSSL